MSQKFTTIEMLQALDLRKPIGSFLQVFSSK